MPHSRPRRKIKSLLQHPNGVCRSTSFKIRYSLMKHFLLWSLGQHSRCFYLFIFFWADNESINAVRRGSSQFLKGKRRWSRTSGDAGSSGLLSSIKKKPCGSNDYYAICQSRTHDSGTIFRAHPSFSMNSLSRFIREPCKVNKTRSSCSSGGGGYVIRRERPVRRQIWQRGSCR